MASNID